MLPVYKQAAATTATINKMCRKKKKSASELRIVLNSSNKKKQEGGKGSGSGRGRGAAATKLNSLKLCRRWKNKARTADFKTERYTAELYLSATATATAKRTDYLWQTDWTGPAIRSRQ